MSSTLPLFHPYKIIEQTSSTLSLASPVGKNAQVRLLRLLPVLSIVLAVVVAMLAKNNVAVYSMIAFAVIEIVVLFFIKTPVAFQMDTMGLNIETASIKGLAATYYLWSDVDYIRYRMVSTKEGKTLLYHAVLKDGAKRKLFSFENYNPTKHLLPEMNAVIAAISRREVKSKT